VKWLFAGSSFQVPFQALSVASAELAGKASSEQRRKTFFTL
jgi:hypothetical protein